MSETSDAPDPGLSSGRRVLTEAMVADARRRNRAGEKIETIARDRGVPASTLRSVVRGETWAWMTEPAPVGKARQLTEQDVAWLRHANRQGESLVGLARQLGVSVEGMRAAVRGRTWAHVTDPPPVPVGGAISGGEPAAEPGHAGAGPVPEAPRRTDTSLRAVTVRLQNGVTCTNSKGNQ